ncbi:MAG: hypothetical protein ACE5OZ_04975 [Candidatus Heimdallarchaeota archaeon]
MIIKHPSPRSMAIAERSVDQRTSPKPHPAMGALGGRWPSTIREFLGLWSEQTIIQVQTSAKREFLLDAGLRGFIGSFSLQGRVVHY